MKPPVILVIDDNPITRKIVRVALHSASYDCCEAEDGQSALALVRQSLPDLVLQDLLLPDMDSFALVKELRAIAKDLPIPILACSGSLSRLEQARNIVLGFTDFLPKPIEPSRLLRTIDAYLAAKRGMEGKPGQNRRVLIADDDPVQRKLLKIHLTQLGYQVAAATNGRDALSQARATPPDAIISDILMPELDGFKLCMEVRRDPHLATIPVILTSVAFIEDADRRLAHNAGAHALILRTADFREIIMALQQLLSERVKAPLRSNVTATAEELYVHRITRQLERQASHNEALTRRMKWIEAELGILAGFAETLRNTSAIETILDEQLHHCLNALGISKGAIYLLDENKTFCLRAQLGYESSKNDLLYFFGHSDVLRLALEHRLLLDIPSDEVAAEVAHQLLRLARAKALLIMPLLLGDEQLGALVIASARRETDGDWYTLIRAVGSQISQAIGLARAISQLREKEERLARIVETVPDGIILLDLNGQVTSANTSAERILGMNTAELTAIRLPFL
ncbi:MAG TPA: response regulator, partial [Ktedonobacterales bacterium]|nr:response regulator [Ktedonobacterales bacterium]